MSGHEIVVGGTGTGKTMYAAVYKAMKSFEMNSPICYIDPKGTDYYQILWWLSETNEGQWYYQQNRHRILFLNPLAKSDWLLAFNAIKPIGEFVHHNPDLVALTATSMTDFLRRQSGYEQFEAPRMQNILNAGIGTLIEGGKGHFTLYDLPLLFRPYYDPTSRRREPSLYNPVVEFMLRGVEHQGTRMFWEDQWPTWSAQARRDWVQSSLSRVFQYIFDQRCLLTICDVRGTLDFQRVVDEGCWLFVHLPESLLKTSTALLGNLIVTSLFYACMRNPKRGYSYRLVLDEAYLFNSGPLSDIYVRARYCQLWITLIVQYLNQMASVSGGHTDERLKEAALSNAQYLTVFNDPEDAEYLASRILPPTGREILKFDPYMRETKYKTMWQEQADNEYFFSTLKPREVVLYNRTGEYSVRTTPYVRIGEIDEGRVNMFEAEHLMATGRPAYQIEGDLMRRHEFLAGMLKPKAVPTPEAPVRAQTTPTPAAGKPSSKSKEEAPLPPFRKVL